MKRSLSFVYPLAALVALAAFGSAPAQGVKVLVEPLTPPAAADTGSGTPTAKPAPVFVGTLLKPKMLVLSSGDDKTTGASLDYSKVLVLSFPTQAIKDLDDEITKLKAQVAAEKDPTKQALYVEQLVDRGKKKATLLLTGVKAVTLYKSGVFTGHFDETKERMTFLIEKFESTPNAATDPPTEYTPDQLKAIYFFPTPPGTTAAPATTPPATTTPKTSGMAPAPPDTWYALFKRSESLGKERDVLAEQFAYLSRQCEEVEHLCAFAVEHPYQLIGPRELLKQLESQRELLRQAVRYKEVQIQQTGLQLAFIPEPLPEQPPPPYESFWCRPWVEVVSNYDEERTDSITRVAKTMNPAGDLQERITRTRCPAFDFRFPTSAYFPIPRFDGHGGRLDSEGVVIYEGMRFVATRDGYYELSFSATTVSILSTLRLQLIFTGPSGANFTLTIPPIDFYPDPKFDGNTGWKARQAYHTGYSRMIADHFAELTCTTVTRQGTARFGSWPEGIASQYEAIHPNPQNSDTNPSGSSSR